MMIVAITSPGGMGSAIGRLLREHGATVRTSLRGRSAASAERARRDGLSIADTDEELVKGADFVLSILPPSDALAIAERLSGPLSALAVKPVYVECNAISPASARRVAELVEKTGCTVIDSGIVGSPPTADPNSSPTFVVSGPHAAAFEPLIGFGLKMRLLEGPIGKASALKLAYGGVQKGIGAIGLAMIGGAAYHGVAGDLREELLEKQPVIAKWLFKQIAQTFPKAYRFVGEMEEIADFHESDEGSRTMYEGMARLYEHIAELNENRNDEYAELVRFVEEPVRS